MRGLYSLIERWLCRISLAWVFFPPKRFLVSCVLCKSIRQQWQAGLSALPVGIVRKYLQQMTWAANDIYGEPCCPSKHSRCGAPATAVRSRACAPRWALGSPAWDETPLDIGTVCVGGVWCLLRCTHRGKGGHGTQTDMLHCLSVIRALGCF